MSRTPITVGVYTANKDANDDIERKLTPLLVGYNIKFIPVADDPELMVALPDFINLFAANQLVIALTDDLNYMQDYDNVVEVSPFPVNPDDYERVAWRLIKIAKEIEEDDY